MAVEETPATNGVYISSSVIVIDVGVLILRQLNINLRGLSTEFQTHIVVHLHDFRADLKIYNRCHQYGRWSKRDRRRKQVQCELRSRLGPRATIANIKSPRAAEPCQAK
jgi:hypothetical protein